MPSVAILLLVFLVVVCVLPTGAYAFGAGDIPDFSYLNDKAFRHGDIENILVELAKQGAGSSSGGLLGFAKNVISTASGGKKFSKDDVKKVYFGNWLRDYSQCMDIAGLSALTADTLVMVVGVLGFLTFGFATEEFQVTADRLGTYLPVEHIDNPKGYAEKEGDARKFHPKLRGPVDNRELEIDEHTGMKKYIATDNQGWDTSTAYIRRSLKACIDHGRKANGNENADLWEAYRLLGQSLHTLEDLLAHSNWCELALRKMGHQDVFCHVGDNVKVNTPNGQAPPLVTGTFGSADFYHSLIGETADHLSQTSVTDLSKKMDEAKNQNQDEALGLLKTVLGKVMSSGGSNQDDKEKKADELKDKSQAYNFDPDNVMPPEVQTQLWELLKWRDDIMRDVIRQLAMVPGLTDLVDSLTDALNAYVYTLLAPYLSPILEQLTGVLHAGGEGVINTEDQYEVFTNPDASDPSHSQLSKDHFALILNEPAGKIARIVVQNSVGLVVEAWGDHGKNDDEVVNKVLEAFFHPYYATGNSQIQNAMLEELSNWLKGLDQEEQQTVLQNLTKDAVKDHKNVRLSDEQVQEVSNAQPGASQYQHSSGGGTYAEGGYGGVGRQHGSSGGQSGQSGGYGSQQSGGHGSQSGGYGGQSGGYGGQSGGYGQSEQSGGYGRSDTSGGYGQSEQSSGGYGGGGYGRQEESGHGRSEGGFGRTEGGYGSQTHESSGGYQPSYQQSSETSGYGGESGGYGGSRRHEESSGYGGDSGGYGSRRTEESSGYGGDSGGYGSRRTEETPSYGGDSGGDSGGYSSRRTEESSGYGGDSGSYGRSSHQESSGYGGDSGGRGERRHHGGEAESGGYGGDSGGYGERRQHGGNDETFGAERLNINDESEGRGERHGRRHHGGEEEGGYGGGGYGGGY